MPINLKYIIYVLSFLFSLHTTTLHANTELVEQETPQAQVKASNPDKVNINSASVEELAASLNGVGLKKAQEIVNYRNQNGPFTHIEQLQEVPGIGPAIMEKNLVKISL